MKFLHPPEVFNGLTHEEQFYVVMSTYEDLSRYRSMSTNMFGYGVDTASGLEVLNRQSPITYYRNRFSWKHRT